VVAPHPVQLGVGRKVRAPEDSVVGNAHPPHPGFVLNKDSWVWGG